MAKRRKDIQIEQKSNNRKKRRGLLVFLIILLIFICFGVSLYYKQIIIPTRESERPLSILLIGSDVSEFRDEYFMGTKAEKTDALIVLTFNPNTYTVDMTSIPRDTSMDYICSNIQYLDGTPYTGEPYQDQINELYQVSNGSIDCLTDTVSNFLNIPIDYYVKVNMDQLSNIIDTVGGIEIEIYAPDYYLSQENSSMTQVYSWTDGDVVTMDGDEALTYARARHDSEKDYGRGIRQQQVLVSTTKQILSYGFDLDLIGNLFDLVESKMPVKLVYEYYQYIIALKDVFGMIRGENIIPIDELPDSVWLNLYEITGFDGNLIGTDKQRQNEIDEFIEYLQSKDLDTQIIKDELISNHQFYNSTYSGHYNVVEEQLYEISNELRRNLELEEEDVEVPSYVYGDNLAYGLIPEETSLAKEGYIYY